MIVRETEEEARSYADNLISKLDLSLGENIKNRSQDAKSLGVARQTELREKSDKNFCGTKFVDWYRFSKIGMWCCYCRKP